VNDVGYTTILLTSTHIMMWNKYVWIEEKLNYFTNMTSQIIQKYRHEWYRFYYPTSTHMWNLNDWRLEKLNNIFTIMASNIIKVIFLNKEDMNEWWWKVLSTILPALILCNFYMIEGRRSWMNSRMWLYRSSLNMYIYLSDVGITGVRRINRFYLTSEWYCFYYPTSTHM